MAQVEREGGEISDGEVPRERDLRERQRERETDRRDEGRSRRDDSYLPVRDSYSSSYTRDGREWSRDRDRDRRDEREWTRDTGRGRYPREPQDGWRNRDRERFYERDWERGPRNNYERPRERGWERDDRIRDRDRRYVDDDHYAPYSRRPDPERRQRSPPRYSRARSPTRYNRPYSRSPSPRFATRVERRRSISRSRDDASSRSQRRREDSIDSKRSGMHRVGDDREQPNRVIQKREPSRSPSERSDRYRYRRRPRTSRSRSPRLNPIRRSPSPVLQWREEKRPERQSPLPSRPGPSEAPALVAEPHDHHEARVAPSIPLTEPQHSHQYPAEATSSRASIDPITPTFRSFHAPSPFAAVGKSVPSPPSQHPSSSMPTPTATIHAPSPKRRVASPSKPPPTGPRSAAAQPAPRVPEIPEYNREDSPISMELDRITSARIPLYAAYAHAYTELRRATTEAELAAIDLRSAEYRRNFAEQQHKNALET